jgi:hypothetical protein
MEEQNTEVVADNPMKTWLVDYVGQKLKPENGEVTVELIVEAMAQEFPDFLLVLAQENFIRGYQQALHDIDNNVLEEYSQK